MRICETNQTIVKVIFLLLIISLFVTHPAIQRVKSKPTTLKVPNDYPTIQEAIDASQPGDTIRVYDGTYRENVTVNKSVILFGSNRETTIIEGGGRPVVVLITKTANATISGFTIKKPSGSGSCALGIFECVNITVSYNIIKQGNYGIQLEKSNNTEIVNNIIINNSWCGIYFLSNSSRYNRVIGNTITCNPIGVNIDSAKSNTFYHNNLVNNTSAQVDTLVAANWDDGYPSGGNYWSNYSDTDILSGPYQNKTGSDGIGDKEHIIVGQMVDKYPLMGMFHSYTASVRYHVNVVSNSTIESFQFFKPNNTINMYVSNSTPTQTHGFCRVRIPHTLMSEPYNVTVDSAKPQHWNYALHDDGAHRWIYFTYQQSKRKIVIQGSNTAPILSILSPQNKTYPVKYVPLTFKVDEPANWTGYSLDDMTNVTITGNTTIPNLPDGSHHITVYANDSAGNMGVSKTVHFSVNTTPPVITIISPENKTYETASIWLNFTVNKITGWIGYSLDYNINKTVTGNTIIMVDDGPHSITVYANDTGGNMGASDTVHFSVDAPPSIVIVSPANGSYTSTLVPLNFTLSESAHWIGYSLDGNANETITGNITITVPSEGLHTVTVYANDTAGHMGVSETVYFSVDTTAPNITDVSQSPEEVMPEDVVQVNATVTDTLSGVKQVALNYTNGNGTWIPVEMSNIAGDVWNGVIPVFPYCTNVTYIIMAEDNVGNTITTEQMELEYQYHVIPEFPSILIFSISIIATLLAVILYRKNQPVHN